MEDIDENTIEYVLQILKISREEQNHAHFYGYGAFEILLEKGATLEGIPIIIQSPCQNEDYVYVITKNQKLQGVQVLAMYNGKEGIYEPQELLNIDDAPNGWSIQAPRHYEKMIEKLELNR